MLTLDAPIGVKPLLVIAVGNPSRGDDAIGPMIAERLQGLRLAQVDVLTDFQLQVEHVIDLAGRRRVVIVDASAVAGAPFSWREAVARPGRDFTTHTLSPDALLHCYVGVARSAAPRVRVLAVRGYSFELGAPLSPAASANLECALAVLTGWLTGRGD